MKKVIFNSKLFPVDNSYKIACLIAGFHGKIASHEACIVNLNNNGYTVVAYDFEPSVITSGDPHQMLDLISGIQKDYSKKIKGFEKVICVGESVGAGIGLSLQRRIPQIKYGIYAVAGISPSASIFEAPIFFFARRTFKRGGYDAAKLKLLWLNHEVSADDPPSVSSPFVIVLGKRDRIVKYRLALQTLKAWQKAGVPIKILTKNNLGHGRTIGWFKKNINFMLAEAEKLIKNET